MSWRGRAKICWQHTGPTFIEPLRGLDRGCFGLTLSPALSRGIEDGPRVRTGRVLRNLIHYNRDFPVLTPRLPLLFPLPPSLPPLPLSISLSAFSYLPPLPSPLLSLSLLASPLEEFLDTKSHPEFQTTQLHPKDIYATLPNASGAIDITSCRRLESQCTRHSCTPTAPVGSRTPVG